MAETEKGRKPGYLKQREDDARELRKLDQHSELIAALARVSEQLAADEAQEKDSDNKRLIREWLTIGLLLVTFISAGAGDVIFYRTMQDGRDEQRPYIWLANSKNTIDFVPVPSTNWGRVIWNWHYYNYGKTVGTNVHIHQWIEIESPLKVVGHFKDAPYPVPSLPDKNDFTGVISDQTLTAAQFNVLDQEGKISLHAIISYRDGYGRQYETGICMRHLATDALMACDGNYVR